MELPIYTSNVLYLANLCSPLFEKLFLIFIRHSKYQQTTNKSIWRFGKSFSNTEKSELY